MVSQKAQKAREFEKGRRSPQERKSRAGVVRKNAQKVPGVGTAVERGSVERDGRTAWPRMHADVGRWARMGCDGNGLRHRWTQMNSDNGHGRTTTASYHEGTKALRERPRAGRGHGGGAR